MNTRNRIIMIILSAVMAIVAVIGVRLKNNENEISEDVLSGKTLVVYFSAQNHTKNLAERIAKKLDADMFEIVPQEKYTVSFDKDKKPLRDYFFETKSSKQSSIKNKKVTIYKYENTYFTEFHDNGIYYDIESTNVSFEDFKYILDIVIE